MYQFKKNSNSHTTLKNSSQPPRPSVRRAGTRIWARRTVTRGRSAQHVSVTRGRVSSRAVPCFRMQCAKWRVIREIANETRRLGHPNALRGRSDDDRGVCRYGVVIWVVEFEFGWSWLFWCWLWRLWSIFCWFGARSYVECMGGLLLY